MIRRLPNATESAVQRLRKAVEVDYEKTWDMNEKKIELRCGEIQRRIEVTLVALILTVIHTSTHVHAHTHTHIRQQVCTYTHTHTVVLIV